MTRAVKQTLGKLSTGISGLDYILGGGIPELSINVIAGPPGSGKTILTQQFIYHNAAPSRKVLYLTSLSEPVVKLFHHMQKFDFFDPSKVNTSVIYLDIGEIMLEQGSQEAIAFTLRHVEEHEPIIVAIDGFKAIHQLTHDDTTARKFSYELSVRLATWGVTTFLVGEYTQEEIERDSIFSIADGIIRLFSESHALQSQRYLHVHKIRGEDYFTGFHPFTVSDVGLTVYPRITTPTVLPDYTPEVQRVSTGLAELDGMFEGGVPAGTATMVAGSAGTGKTLLGLYFVTAGAARGEPGVIVAFQENPVQLRQIARAFGWDLYALEQKGLLTYLYHSPVEMQPDIHAALVREAVEKVGAKRVLIDPITDIESVTPDKLRFKDYIYSLVTDFKLKGVTMLMTSEIVEPFGPFQLSEYGVSFVADNVILLRYMEMMGRMGRVLSVMKVRGSQHSKEIREFEILPTGIQIGSPVRSRHGILTGFPVTQSEDLMLRDLPSRSQVIVQTLSQHGPLPLPTLQEFTGLHAKQLEHELTLLQEQGLVIGLRQHDEVVYKVTV